MGLRLEAEAGGQSILFFNVLAGTHTQTHTDSSAGVTSVSFFFPLYLSTNPFLIPLLPTLLFHPKEREGAQRRQELRVHSRNPSKRLFSRSCPSLTTVTTVSHPSGLNPQPPETPRVQGCDLTLSICIRTLTSFKPDCLNVSFLPGVNFQFVLIFESFSKLPSEINA